MIYHDVNHQLLVTGDIEPIRVILLVVIVPHAMIGTETGTPVDILPDIPVGYAPA
jgi:hypothetical protein